MHGLQPSRPPRYARHSTDSCPRSNDWHIVMMCIAVLCLLPLLAPAAEPGDDIGTGTLYFSSASAASVQAPRLHTKVSMQVSGIVARVEVTQSFQNTSDNWVEGLYAFPLPETAAVDRLRMQIGSRVIVGEIQERAHAQALYEQAKANGQRASLVQQHRPNLFRTNVANIGPRETIDITIGYLQIIDQQDGRYSVRFPLTITPRYLPGGADDNPSLTRSTSVTTVSSVSAGPENATLNDLQPLLAHPDTDHNSVSFDIWIAAGVPVANIASAYHPIAIEEHNESYRVQLTESRTAPDHDFLLAWTPVVHGEPAAALFREHTKEGVHVLLMLLPPQEKVQIATPREVIFIIDTSGSMSGDPLEQAQAALRKALATLAPTDLFNIIQFNSNFDAVFPATVPASEANLEEARDYVDELRATGGTNMLPALNAAMATPVIGNYLRQIIFITDGAVGNEDQLTRAIHEQLGTARLFTVGIGSAPNGFFMRKAAQMGRGTFTYIGNAEEVDERMSELIRKVQQPALTNIEVQWPKGVQPDMAASRIGDLYAGEPLLVTARMPVEARGLLQISGISSTPWTRQLPLHLGEPRPGISTLWARHKIESLMDEQASGVSDDEIRTQVLQLALSYGLVTKYTSLVAVDRTPARVAEESLESQQVPNAKPAGSEWRAASYPRTATPARLQLLIGALAFMLAWALVRCRSLHAERS